MNQFWGEHKRVFMTTAAALRHKFTVFVLYYMAFMVVVDNSLLIRFQ